MATFDEVLVAQLKKNEKVLATCKAPFVYHLEVFQKSDSLDRYPCVVYQLISDTQEKELGQGSGVWNAIYEVTCLSKKSSDIRKLAASLVDIGSDDNNDAVYAEHPNVVWIEVEEDSDLNEFALEQQEKGIRSSVLTISIAHRGKL